MSLSGANLAARIDGGINDEMGYRGLLGLGKTDVFFGGLFKWMPVPFKVPAPLRMLSVRMVKSLPPPGV